MIQRLLSVSMKKLPGGRRPLLASVLLLAGLVTGWPQRVEAADPQAPSSSERMITAQSIWSQADAIQRASEQLPRGAVVTRTRCSEVTVRSGNFRSICTLTYEPAQAP